MQKLMNSLIDQIDLLESKTTSSFPWKQDFDQIIAEMASVNDSATTHAAQTGNPLFGLLVKQNEVLMELVMVVLVAGLKK